MTSSKEQGCTLSSAPSLSMRTLQNMGTSKEYNFKGLNKIALHYRLLNIVSPVDETLVDKGEGGRRRENIRGRNKRFV
jgi:hypothetical protein